MENKDYGEIFCQAVDEIVGQRLESIKFDSTILCTITDASACASGKYVVTNNGGIAKFEAYSENDSYRENDNVYVQIPNGDWDQQKIIIGKKSDKTNEPYIYKKPFSSLVDITGNLISDHIEKKRTGLVANKNYSEENNGKEYYINLWSYNIEDSGAEYQDQGLVQSSYTRLGIQAGFQSWLNTFYTSTNEEDAVCRAVSQGQYGLRLKVTAKREKVISVDGNEEGANAVYILELNTDDMNGNPYNFDSFYTQEKVFDISEISEIVSMELQFYEVTGSFMDSENVLIPDKDFLGNLISPNLFVNDVYITLGYDVAEFDTEMVQVYTLDSTTYSKTAENVSDNHKKIQLRWVHKLENGIYKSITDNDNIGDYTVYWYRYKLGSPSADQYSGVYWKYLSTQENFKYEINDADWVNYNNQNTGNERTPGFFYSWSLPDTTVQTEQYKAIIVYNGIPYRSNILTFQNKDEVVSAPTVDAVQALSINCEDNTYGNYRIYNNGNSLLDQSQSPKQREWKLFFKSALDKSDDTSPTELTEAEQVEWIIPVYKSMIVLDADSYKDADKIEYDYLDDGKTENHIHIFRYGNNNDITGSNTQQYRIRSYYSQTYSNNTIQCKIIKNKITYTATKEMTFGIAGTTGTDCTFILDFDNGITAVGPEDSSEGLAVSVTARLYDYENNEVDLTDYADKITWSWKDTTTAKNIQIGSSKGITIPLTYTGGASLTYNYNILQATLTGWGNFVLEAYLPVPVRKKIDYNYISGTTQVIYNSNGEIIDYFKNPYKLYEMGNEKSGVSWECINNIDNETDKGYTPKVSESNNGEYYLTPLSFYVEKACENVCVVAKDSNNSIIWSQPVLIMTNRYPSAMLNNWDGSLDVGSTDSGTILSPRLAAGRKESDNTFSGVVLGDWTPTISSSELTAGTGLFGYYKGEQSYGFRDDGTAFIGKSGAGRISFKGDEGIIESAGFSATNGSGMQINLKDNVFSAKRNGQKIFTLQGADPYFKITNKDQKTLLYIGDSSYYLQSANYPTTQVNGVAVNSGTHLDLTNGNLITNSGTFYGQINIQYNGAYTWTGYNSLKSLNDILDQLYNNTEGANTLAWQAYSAATQAAYAATRAEIAATSAQNAINALTNYFNITDYTNYKSVITITSGSGAVIQMGNSITVSGAYLNMESITGTISMPKASSIYVKNASGTSVALSSYIQGFNTVTFG